jgi:hypothetical protein
MHRHLDRLARRARGRDDDDASGRRPRRDERVMIEWEIRVADPPLLLLLAAQLPCGGFVCTGVAVDLAGPDVAPPCPAGWRTTVGGAAGCAAGFGEV